MVLRLSLYSFQSALWYSDYPLTHHSLPDGNQTIPILITVSVVVLRLFLYTSQFPRWNSDYPNTHHSLSGGTQTILILITVFLMAQTILILITVSLLVLRLSLYSSQSLWWHLDYPYTHHSLPGGSENLVTHFCLLGGTQTIPLLIKYPWLCSDYTFTDQSLSVGPQTIPIFITVYLVAQTISYLITVSLVVLRLSLYSSQSLWLPSEYPNTHHSLPCGSDNLYIHHSLRLSLYSSLSLFGGTPTIPILSTVSLVALVYQAVPKLIRVSLVELRLYLHSSQSPWWYSDYPYDYHSLPGGTQIIPTLITVSLVVLRLSLYSSQVLW